MSESTILAEAVKNPFSDHDQGLASVFSGKLIIRGDTGSQKDGFTMQTHSVLVFDNEERAGYILCFKTLTHWVSLRKAHSAVFAGRDPVDWDVLQRDDRLDKIIALKDAQVDRSKLPRNSRESRVSVGETNEILIRKQEDEQSLTTGSLDGHSLTIEQAAYPQWIGFIRNMARVEAEAIEFRAANTVHPAPFKPRERAISGLPQPSGTDTDHDTVSSDDSGRSTQRKMVVIAVSAFVGIAAAGYVQYQKRQELERQRVAMEEQQLAEQARRMAEEARLVAVNTLQQIPVKAIQETVANTIQQVQDGTGFSGASWIAMLMVLIIALYLARRFFCSGTGNKKWRRGADARLYSID